MKNYVFGIMGLFAILTSCSSQKKLVAKAPFTVGIGYSQERIGGKEESGKRLLVKIPVSDMEGYTLEDIYFRGQIGAVALEEENGQKYAVTNLQKENNIKPDIVMHKDPKQEVGNQPPRIKNKEELSFPFELKDSEAVLGFSKNGKTKYCKVSGIKDRAALVYPSKPQQ